MSDALEREAMPRRRALSLLGLAAAAGLAAPRLVLTASAAAPGSTGFAQDDKPLPGEGDRARISPQQDKPIADEEARARRLRLRRKRAQQRRLARRKQRSKSSSEPLPLSERKPR
jgi:hypothetical protein